MRNSIKANDGMILTNGEIYGTEIFLADGVDPCKFYQISIAEYNSIIKEKEESITDEY